MTASRVITLPLSAGLAALLAFTPLATSDQVDQRSTARLEAENARLAKLLELAAGREFYLLLDPERGQLSLMCQGAVLREFPVLVTEVGRRRAFFGTRSLPGDWADSVWHDGQLEPARRFERLEIDPPDSPVDPDSLSVFIPPTPDEAIPAPDRFIIHYRDSKAIEIIAQDTTALFVGARPPRPSVSIGERLARAVAPWRQPKVLLQLHIPAADARALYRALPENGEFLLLYWPKEPA